MELNLTSVLIMRLVVAGLCGSAVGLERELRAKEAGLRTHFLVSLGSCLLMIVSQYGFNGAALCVGVHAADPARVAAQIVSGIGFIGAGTIMVQKQFVRGLTTAAGLWVAAGIGMTIGGGLYILGVVTTGFMLIGLELFRLLLHNLKLRHSILVFTAPNDTVVNDITEKLQQNGWLVQGFDKDQEKHGGADFLRVTMILQERSNHRLGELFVFMQQFPKVTVEKFE